MREKSNLRDASRRVRDAYENVFMQLNNSELSIDAASSAQRGKAIMQLKAIINNELSRIMSESKFDPGENIHVDDDDDDVNDNSKKQIPLKLQMWRLLVEASGMSEA